MNKKIIYVLGIIAVLTLLILGGWYFFINSSNNGDNTPTSCGELTEEYLSLQVVKGSGSSQTILRDLAEKSMGQLKDKYKSKLISCPDKEPLWQLTQEGRNNYFYFKVRSDLFNAIQNDKIKLDNRYELAVKKTNLEEINCDTYPYDFLNINIVQEKTCDEDYYGACNLREQVSSIVTNLRIKYNDQLICPVKGIMWKEGSQIDWKEVFIEVRQDLVQAIAKDNIWNKNINMDNGTVFNVQKINPELIPYLENDKYCEKNSDCTIEEVGCVVGSHNPYSNHYFVNGCDAPLTPLRYPNSFTPEQISEYQTKNNYFTTEQLGCVNNQCTEKYIWEETGEEF